MGAATSAFLMSEGVRLLVSLPVAAVLAFLQAAVVALAVLLAGLAVVRIGQAADFLRQLRRPSSPIIPRPARAPTAVGRGALAAATVAFACAVALAVAVLKQDWARAFDARSACEIVLDLSLAGVGGIAYSVSVEAAHRGCMRSIHDDSWLTNSMRSLVPERWRDAMIGTPGRRTASGVVVGMVAFLATAPAVGALIGPIVEKYADDRRVNDEKPSRAVATERTDAATTGSLTDETPAIGPPPASPTADEVCGYDVAARMGVGVPDHLAASLVDAWRRHGAAVAGCPDNGTERRGAMWVARLARGESDPSVVIVGATPPAAVVFDRLAPTLDELLKSGALAGVRPRVTTERGDFQVFVRRDEACELHERVTFQGDYVALPPSVAAHVMKVAVERGRRPTRITRTSTASADVFDLQFGTSSTTVVRDRRSGRTRVGRTALPQSASCRHVPAYEALRR